MRGLRPYLCDSTSSTVKGVLPVWLLESASSCRESHQFLTKISVKCTFVLPSDHYLAIEWKEFWWPAVFERPGVLMASCQFCWNHSGVQSPPQFSTNWSEIMGQFHYSHCYQPLLIMSMPSCLPPFNSSATQVGMFELSNVLPNPRWLDFFIKLIPTEKVS